jgi:hypothetical protein
VYFQYLEGIIKLMKKEACLADHWNKKKFLRVTFMWSEGLDRGRKREIERERKMV